MSVHLAANVQEMVFRLSNMTGSPVRKYARSGQQWEPRRRPDGAGAELTPKVCTCIGVIFIQGWLETALSSGHWELPGSIGW